MNIKGQHLRIFLNVPVAGSTVTAPVAAATNCDVHIQTNFQDISNKDTIGEWVENEPVGISWDVNVDAMVISPIGHTESGRGACSQYWGVGYFYYPQKFHLDKGDKIQISTNGAPDVPGIGIVDHTGTLAQTTTSGTLSYTADVNREVYMAVGGTDEITLSYMIIKNSLQSGDFISGLMGGTPVTVKFGVYH